MNETSNIQSAVLLNLYLEWIIIMLKESALRGRERVECKYIIFGITYVPLPMAFQTSVEDFFMKISLYK